MVMMVTIVEVCWRGRVNNATVNEKDVMGLQWKGSNRNPNTSKRLRACVVLLDKT